MSDPRTRANEVAGGLRGTVRNLYDFATEEEINNKEFCKELDSLVFECEKCGWWCDIDEESDDQMTCDECYVARRDIE